MPLYIHAPHFYATEHGVSLATLGIILLALRLIDAVCDPLIGYVSDQFQQQRRTIITVAALSLVAGFSALFATPPTPNHVLWFTIFIFLATTAFSVLSINVNTLGALWSKDSTEKTRITGMREGLGLIGLLLAVSLPAILQHTMSAVQSFLVVSTVLAILTVVALWLFNSWWHQHNTASVFSKRPLHMQHIIRNLTSSERRFYGIYFLSMLASAMPAVLILFFIDHILAAQKYTGLFLALYFLSGAAAMPLWQYISRIHSKHIAWFAASMLAVVSFVWAALLGTGDIWAFAVICIVSGTAFGADLALPPSILADTIQNKNTTETASFQFGLFAFLAKLALAVASAIALPTLNISGFEATAQNSSRTLLTLSVLYAAIPCALKLIAASLIYLSKGDNHDQNANITHRSTYAN